jgi:hypothetical protein
MPNASFLYAVLLFRCSEFPTFGCVRITSKAANPQELFLSSRKVEAVVDTGEGESACSNHLIVGIKVAVYSGTAINSTFRASRES